MDENDVWYDFHHCSILKNARHTAELVFIHYWRFVTILLIEIASKPIINILKERKIKKRNFNREREKSGMYVIGRREFFSLFKGIKSIMIIAMLLGTSYYSAKFSNLLTSGIELTKREAENIHTFGLLALILFFGQLFVMGLSHDSINRETHERTMRFLVTRTSRTSIILGKFFGIWLFWLICLTISFLLTSIFSQKIDVFIFSQTISLLAYQIALTILLSVLIPKPGFTVFLGIVVGLAFPILEFWFAFTSNVWVGWMKFITPYYYLDRDDYTFLVIALLAGIMLVIANLIFKRREC